MPSSEPKWLVAARELVGLKEIVGSRHEAKVLKFYAEAGHSWVKDDETAWCAAFANAMLGRAGIKGTGSLAARSFLSWGEKLAKPRVGCIVVFKRGSSSWQGHVAFFIREVSGKIEVLGGNQGNAVSIAKYPKSSLLGYRWPGAGVGAVKPDPEIVPPPKYTSAEIKDVQRRLIGHGYVRVGGIDGVVGDNTKGAIRDFRANNGLPEGEDIDAELIAALKKPDAVRPVIAPERATATVKDLRAKGSEIVVASDVVKIGTAVAGAGTVAAPAADFLADTGEQVSDLTDKLTPFQSLLQFFADYVWIAVLIIVAIVGWYGIKIARARLRDHQLGNTAVVNLPEKTAP